MGNQDILQKIRDGVYKLAHKRKGKSEIWNLFAEVIKDDDSILDGYLCCRNCIRLYRFDGRRSSNLNRHKCYSSFSRAANIKDNNFALNRNLSAGEDVKASDFVATLDGRDEVDNSEDPPHKRRSLRGNSNGNIKLSKYFTNTSSKAKQMENLCELLKSDLEEIPEEHCASPSNTMQQKAESKPQESESYTQLDVDDVLHNIHSGVYKLSKKRGGKSKIWNIFAEITKDDNAVLEGYLCCRKCIRLYRFDGIRTSNLNRHKCYSSISKAASIEDSNFALNEHSSTDGASDENLKTFYSITKLDAHNELQDHEFPPHTQLAFCGNSKGNSNLSQHCTTKYNRAHEYAERVESFCEKLKSDMENILQKIHSGVYKLSQKRKGKSKIWNIFAEIRKDDNSVLEGFLCCRKCIRLYRFDGRRTSNLNRHRCYSSISKVASIDDSNFAFNENSSSGCDDANVRSHDPLATSNDELQDCESTPRKLRIYRVGNGAPDVKLSKYRTTTRSREHKFAKQVDSLCEMIKSDLQDLPEELFYNAKWKIMDVLRDVHRTKLENKTQPSVFSTEKIDSANGVRIKAIPSIAVNSSAPAHKTVGNVLEFLAQ